MTPRAIDTLSIGTMKAILESLSYKRSVNGYLDSEDTSRLYAYECELKRRKRQAARRARA
jgi:hypothetical protein